MFKTLTIATLLAFTLGCDPGDDNAEAESNSLALGGKADQACDPNASDAHGSDDDATTESADTVDTEDVVDTDVEATDDGIVLDDDTAESGGDSLAEELDEEGLVEENPEELEVEAGETTEEEAPCVDAQDPFAEAYDVNLHKISFPEGTPAPTYAVASTDTPFRLGGTEFWQKWAGGENPTYSYYAGTPFGQRCMYASARRFEAIMAVAPESLQTLLEESGWSGSFFNWNDDFSQSTWGDGSSARLWAWRTTLIKWISQTNVDGTCYLPTLSMVESLAEKCADRAESYDGEIQGCTN